MSLDLYADDLVERVGELTPTTQIEPGAFDGFFRGAGMATMRGFAQAARSAGMVTSAAPVLADQAASSIGGQDTTTLSDRYFRALDDTLGSAVDYWTPKPNEVGVAGQMVGSLLSIVPMAIASPPLVALQAADVGTELVQQGVSSGKAAAVAGAMTAGQMAGIWMPILGNNLWQRTLLGGAGFNMLQGAAMRGSAELVLAGHPAADQFQAFDPTSVTLDALLGMAFGSFAHVVPAQRAAGKEAWETLGRWAQSMSPSDVAAVATLRTAQHLNTDSTPGIPVGPQDIDTHVQRMRQAIDQLVRGEPVDVQSIKPPEPAPRDTNEPIGETIPREGETMPPVAETIAREADTVRAAGDPAFVVDAAKRAEQLKNAADLLAQADAARREEGLPRIADTPLRVPADVTQLPHDLQALHVGEALALRLREGGMGADEASAHAAVWSAFFKTAAEKYGVAPADLLERYGVDVQRLNSAQNLPDALEQRGQAPNRYMPRDVPEGERLPLEHGTVRTMIQNIANEEAGWATIGGRLDIARLIKEKGPGAVDQYGRPTTSAVAFTEWIPKAEWWTGRPGHPGRGLNEGKTRAAVKKALAGEKLSKLERDTVDYLVDVVNERLAAEKVVGDDRWNEVAAATLEQGLEPTTQNVLDANVLARAVALDRAAVEAAAAKYVPTKDAESMMAEARRIIREHEEKQRQAAGQEAAPAEPGGAAARGGEGADGQTLYQRDEPGTWYYSELARQLDAAQIKSAPAKGWSDYLKSLPQKGVKAEEIRWSGLEDWLALQEGKVTKEQVTEFLKQGGVRVEEEMLGEGEQRGTMDPEIRADVELLTRNGLTIDQDPAPDADGPRYGVIHDDSGEIFASPGDADTFRASRNGGTPGEAEVSDIPDHVVDAIDRVLTYLNQPGVEPRGRGDLELELGAHNIAPEVLEQAGNQPPMVSFRREGLNEPWMSWEELEADPRFTDEQINLMRRYEQVVVGGSDHPTKPTRYGAYQLPGGKNYRELLLTSPGQPDVARAELDRYLQQLYAKYGPTFNDGTLTPEERTRLTALNQATHNPPRSFTSSHFDTENILAHVRFNERTDADGKKVLFLEELQSDWGKAGRKQGFTDPAVVAKREALFNELNKIENAGGLLGGHPDVEANRARVAEINAELGSTKTGTTPPAPFVGKTEEWTTLVLKRMIRYAAENGFDRVAWTRGEQQVERYTGALRKAVDVIEWTKTDKGVQLVGYKGKDAPPADLEFEQTTTHAGEPVYSAGAYDVSHNPGFPWRWSGPGGTSGGGFDTAEQAIAAAKAHFKSQNRSHRTKVVDTTEKENELSDAIGKAMADQILKDPGQSGTIEGDNIKIDDTGMAGYYDRMLPAIANTVLKKLGGGKVGETKIALPTAESERPLVRAVDQAPPDFEDMPANEHAAGITDFPNGEPALYGEARISIGGEDHDVEVVLGGAGVHILGADPDFELRIDIPTHKAERDDALEWLGTVWNSPGFWNAMDVIGTLPNKHVPEGSAHPAFDLTPELKRRALDGLPLFQGGGRPAQPPRGSITFGKDRTLIALFEDANASTLVHESGHMFLQMTRDLATREGVPPEAAQDWATLASWLKIEGGDIPREAHEQFARGWEKYLQEGVAPNEALRSVFQRFRDWLLEVYQRLAGRGLDAELSDSVRGVMARMLDSQARDPSQPAPQAPGATRPETAPGAQPSPIARQGAQPAPAAATESAPPGESPASAVPSSSSEGGGAAPGGPAAETPDMVANEAHRIATERPELRIRTGTDEEGGAIYQSATDFLEAAKAEAAKARDDKRLITAAAECLLGNL